MTLKDKAGACKGKIGKRGSKWLIEHGATAANCQLACLNDDDCRFSHLKKSGKPERWKCASFKKCRKTKKDDRYMMFKKSTVKSSTAESLIWKDEEA
jgi:hypothetical protein